MSTYTYYINEMTDNYVYAGNPAFTFNVQGASLSAGTPSGALIH